MSTGYGGGTDLRPRMRAVLLCFLPLLWASFAQGQIVLDPAKAPFSVAAHAEVMAGESEYISENPSAREFYSIEAIIAAAHAGGFEPVDTRHIGLGITGPGVVHVRVPVKNPFDSPRAWVLAFNQAAEYYYKVEFVEDGEPLPAAPIFEFNIFAEKWASDDVLIHTEFTMPPLAEGYLYITYENLTGGAPMTIETPAGYELKRQRQDLQFFAIVGLTLGLVTITVLLMMTLRRFVALYYAGAVISGQLVVLLSEQYHLILFPGAKWLPDSDSILPYAVAFGPVFALLFQRQFFTDVGGTGKVFGRILLAVSLWCAASMMLFMEFEIVPIELLLIGLLVCIPLIAINGIIALVKGYVGRWPFFFGSVVFAGSFFVKVLSYEFSAYISAREASLVLLFSLAFESIAYALTMFAQVRFLRREKEQALEEQVLATKEKFELAQSMSHAAHDIQQPLSSLRLALAATASRENNGPDFHRAIDYLEEIVSQQLMVAKNETGEAHAGQNLPDPKDAVALGVILDNVAVMFGDEARSKGLKLRVVDSDAITNTNVFALMRIVSNLVSNAVKNTETGGVLIGTRHVNTELCLDIYDTGCGIDQDKLGKLRKPYKRAGPYEGSGLGLSIAFALCQEHDLTLEVVSCSEKGSRFRVKLPKA